eukprot:scaffold1896_cov140-Skeletonema_menzelii.AAC.6
MAMQKVLTTEMNWVELTEMDLELLTEIGVADGADDGDWLGVAEGEALGADDGDELGTSEGEAEGETLGLLVG